MRGEATATRVVKGAQSSLVAQICNLLYRGFATRRAQNVPEASGLSQPANCKSALPFGGRGVHPALGLRSCFSFLLSDFCFSSAAYISITHWQELRQAARLAGSASLKAQHPAEAGCCVGDEERRRNPVADDCKLRDGQPGRAVAADVLDLHGMRQRLRLLQIHGDAQTTARQRGGAGLRPQLHQVYPRGRRDRTAVCNLRPTAQLLKVRHHF